MAISGKERHGDLVFPPLPDASSASLHGFIQEAIVQRSTVHSDGWRGYLGLEGYVHDRQVQSHQVEGEHLLPHAADLNLAANCFIGWLSKPCRSALFRLQT